MLREKLKSRFLRPLLLLAALLALSQTASAATFSAGQKLYLQVQSGSNWSQSSPDFKAQFYVPGGSESADVAFTLISGTDKYELTIPSGAAWEKVHIKRFKGGSTTELWNAIYNIPASDAYNMITVNSYLEGSPDNAGYSWNNYSSSSVESGTYIYGYFDNGSPAKISDITSGGSFVIDATSYERKLHYVLYDNSKRYGHSGGNATQTITNASGSSNGWKDCVMLTEVYSTSNDYFVVTIPANNKITLNYQSDFGFNGDNTQGYTSGSGRGVWFTDLTPTTVTTKTYTVNFLTGSGTQADSQSCEGGKTVTLSASLSTGEQFYFNIYEGDNFKTSVMPTNDTDVKNGFSFTSGFGGRSKYAWKGGNGTVTATVTLDANGAVTSIAFAGPELGGGDVDDTPSKYFLRGNWNNFSNATDEDYRFYGSGNTLTFTADNFPSDIYFMIFDDNGNYYAIEGSKNGHNVTKGEGLNDHGEQYDGNYRKMLKTQDTKDKIATFTLTLDANGWPQRLDVTTVAKTPEFADDPSRAGNVYLIASQLNDNRISPEWLMTPDASGKTFTLTNFAMRSYLSGGNEVKAGYPSVVWYDADGTVHTKIFDGLENLPNVGYNLTPGWAYTATFNLEDESLVMAPLSDGSFSEYGKDVLPYVGLLGKNFIQSTKFKTAGDYGNNPSDTSAGWQEAYIQYDASGQPVLDAEGAAYYNTYWPPRNNILMQSYLGDDVDPLNTSVDALTFTLDPRLTKSKSEWKEVLTGEEYENLLLEEGKAYYRYVIPSMWILGDFKLWTGWAGQHASWGAQWDHHIFWGPKDENKTIASRTTYYPTVKEGTKDYSTGTERMYYQTVELFIPVTGEPGQQATSFDFYNARLYMTEAAGDAQIDSKTLNKHGGYYPSLGVFPSGYHLSAYKVTRHLYDPNAVAGTYLPCDKTGATGVNGVIVEQSNLTYPDAARFAEDFSQGGVFQRYVDDGVYAPGLYIYSLDVEFTNELGETRTDKVWSPYIEILDDDITLTLRNAQLIELPADNNYGGYSHVTYSASGDRVLVKIENDKVTRAGRLNDLLSGDELTAAVAEIYENTGAWTNMTLLRTAKPSKYTQQGGKDSDITAFTISKGGSVIADLRTVTPIDGYRYAICDNGTTFGAQDFTAEFVASFSTENDGAQAVNSTAHTTYQPRFMLPGFRDCGVGLNGSPMPANEDYSATHDMIKAEGVKSKTHTVSLTALIDIVMPKISYKTAGLRDAVLNAISVKLALDGAAPSSLSANAAFLTDNNINAGLQYFYQSPYDWMEPVNPTADLDKRQWKAVPHTWSLDGTAYAEGIEGVTPTLSTSSATLALDPAFFAPTVEDFKAYKVNVPVEGKENAYVTKVMIMSADVAHTGKDTDPEHADRVDTPDRDSYMPVNQFSNYVVVSKNNAGGDLNEGDIMTHEVAQNADVHHHVWTSNEFTWFAGMDNIRPDLTLYLSYAYVFKARPGYDDPTGYLGLEGDFPYIRYDRKAQAAGAPARAASASASTTLADDDDSFIFDPVYAAFDLNEIPTAVEGIEVAGQTIVAGQGFIDLMGVQGVVYASDGRQVYAGDSRVDVATGVYVVKTATSTLKVIVK